MNVSFSRDRLNAELKAKITGVIQILTLFPDCIQLIDENGKVLELDSQNSHYVFQMAQNSIYFQKLDKFPEIYDCLADFLTQVKI